MEWGTPSSGVGFFCFHALGDTKQKKPTPLDRGPPLHVNRPLITFLAMWISKWATAISTALLLWLLQTDLKIVHVYLDNLFYFVLYSFLYFFSFNSGNNNSLKDHIIWGISSQLFPILIWVTLFRIVCIFFGNQERIKGTEKASPIHTLFHR